MKPLPIRWKFAAWTATLAALVLVLHSAATLVFVYRAQIAKIDAELAGEARHIADLDREGEPAATADHIMRHEPWLAYAHFDAEGRLHRHSTRLPLATARAALKDARLHTARGAAVTWRAGAFREGRDTFVVAYDLTELRLLVNNLLSGYALTLPFVLLVAGGGGWWIAGNALAPVRRLTVAAEGVQAARLHQRVPVPAARDDIQRLATVFNAMLVRLEASFVQSQRFAADASHELRTPLTIMRGEIENLLHGSMLDATLEARLVSLQEEISRLDHITDHLLLLARFDAGKVSLRQTRVDFSALVREACEDAELLAAAHAVTLRAQVAPDLHVRGDPPHLRRMLLNVLQNAMLYNRPGGEASCILAAAEGRAVVRIANTGPAIAPELRERLFERFSRGDPSRTDRRGHGLGLSLCREIAHAHGGTIVLAQVQTEGWVEFVVEFPLAE